MTHSGTYMALALNGTDTKVCYTTGLHAVDLRDLDHARLRGRQPVEIRLTFLNTEAKVVLDDIRLVSELTPEEAAGLIPAGFDLRLAELAPTAYHGLEALNARGLTLLIVTHDAEIGDRARRRVRMDDGGILEDRCA